MLEQLYFVSQITAAVFVVASILFLAVSVRQNSKLLHRTMMEDQRTMMTALFERIATNKEFAEFQMLAGTDFDSLDKVDQYRALFLAQLNLRASMHAIQARQEGFVTDIDWREMSARLKVAGERQNIALAWQRMKSAYPKQLQETLEKMTGLGAQEA